MESFISDLYMLFNLCCPKVSIKPKYKNRKQCIVKNELYKNYL